MNSDMDNRDMKLFIEFIGGAACFQLFEFNII